ncbi:MAG: hypothetical protein ACI4UC_06520, partial [Alloprevotella sp.]
RAQPPSSARGLFWFLSFPTHTGQRVILTFVASPVFALAGILPSTAQNFNINKVKERFCSLFCHTVGDARNGRIAPAEN